MLLFSTDAHSAILSGDSLGNTVSPESLLLGNLHHNLVMMSGGELGNRSVHRPGIGLSVKKTNLNQIHPCGSGVPLCTAWLVVRVKRGPLRAHTELPALLAPDSHAAACSELPQPLL